MPGRKPRLLSNGRPPVHNSHKATVVTTRPSSRATRGTIRTHHRLHKLLSQARASGDAEREAALEAQINEEGGLTAYQTASLTGQRRDRGGDTSRKLIEWMDEMYEGRLWRRGIDRNGQQWKMLDVGALSTDTAAGRCGGFDVDRIDLHSQGSGILEQDFMTRPLPLEGEKGDVERFNIVCLSLVVNYVPDAKTRGEMLKRVRDFLLPSQNDKFSKHNAGHCCGGPEDHGPGNEKGERYAEHGPFPALFLVLPSPCVINSRYLSENHLAEIMGSLGFRMLQMKVSAKLAYYLWKWDGVYSRNVPFPKKEISPGSNRNNFAIVLE